MKRIALPEDKAEGLCLGYPYNTELVNADGVCIHFWLGEDAAPELAARLLKRAKRERDIVGCTWSDGAPVGFWAQQHIGSTARYIPEAGNWKRDGMKIIGAPRPWGKRTDEEMSRVDANIVVTARAGDDGDWAHYPRRMVEAHLALIAAAPDLLAQLREARRALAYLAPERFDDDAHKERWGAFLESIDTAIAAAEGDTDYAENDRNGVDFEAVARAAGWTHGGDNGGFWFHEPTWGHWKSAASWAGTEHAPENGQTILYDTAEQVCRGEHLGGI
jgi:hypothetical protein